MKDTQGFGRAATIAPNAADDDTEVDPDVSTIDNMDDDALVAAADMLMGVGNAGEEDEEDKEDDAFVDFNQNLHEGADTESGLVEGNV
jgi:hypothetical protein